MHCRQRTAPLPFCPWPSTTQRIASQRPGPPRPAPPHNATQPLVNRPPLTTAAPLRRPRSPPHRAPSRRPPAFRLTPRASLEASPDDGSSQPPGPWGAPPGPQGGRLCLAAPSVTGALPGVAFCDDDDGAPIGFGGSAVDVDWAVEPLPPRLSLAVAWVLNDGGAGACRAAGVEGPAGVGPQHASAALDLHYGQTDLSP